MANQFDSQKLAAFMTKVELNPDQDFKYMAFGRINSIHQKGYQWCLAAMLGSIAVGLFAMRFIGVAGLGGCILIAGVFSIVYIRKINKKKSDYYRKFVDTWDAMMGNKTQQGM